MNADNVSKVLDQLAARFGVAGAALWAQYWHANLIDAVTYMLISVAFGAACFGASRRIEIQDSDFYWVRPACMIASGAIVAFGIAANLTDVVIPQGAALHALMGK